MLPLEMVYSFDPVPPPPSAFQHPEQHLYEPVLAPGGDDQDGEEGGIAERALPEEASTSDRRASRTDFFFCLHAGPNLLSCSRVTLPMSCQSHKVLEPTRFACVLKMTVRENCAAT